MNTTTDLDAARDRRAAITWLIAEQNRRAARIYTDLAGSPAERHWHGTPLDAIAATGHPVREGKPA